MPKYTTGEIANICGVSVRTVQYYDTRGILVPEELSEGGRRIYSEDDLKRMKVICFLRELDLPIESIKKLLDEQEPEALIMSLLDEQQDITAKELSKLNEKQKKLCSLRDNLKRVKSFSVDSIADIAHIMKNKRRLRLLRIFMLVIGIIMDIIEVCTLVLWIAKGIWLPFVLGMIVVVLLGILISVIYFSNIMYICPECHAIFKPRLGEAFWAHHTPNTRRLTCPYCRRTEFCMETMSKNK